MVLRDAARALTELGTWTATLTEDFVVLPADFEIDDLPAVIQEISPDRLTKIQANGWL